MDARAFERSLVKLVSTENILSHEDTKIYGCNAEERAVIDGLLAEESSFRDNGLNPVFVSKIVISRR